MPAVPEGFCNSLNDANWIQTLMNLIAQGVAKFDGSGFTVVLSQATAPGANDRDKLWYDTDVGRIYRWNGGAWVSPHPYPANGIAGLWVEATPAQIWSFDGGDGSDPAVTPPSTDSGAMWVINTAYAGRSPMGAGSIPTANPAKVLAIGENYGEGAHVLTASELPSAIGGVSVSAPLGLKIPVQAGFSVQEAGGDSNPSYSFSGTPPTFVDSLSGSITGGADSAHQTVHPVRGQYYIVRSARVNYVGA